MLSPDKLRDQLEARRAQIEVGIRNLEAQIIANRGALQAIEETLALLAGDGEDDAPQEDAEG